MKVPFLKKASTPREQVELLRTRGVIIDNNNAAEQYFRYHNYYHVSGYVYYFETKGEVRTHELSRPVRFDDITALVAFDSALREHCLHAVFSIEAALRCVISGEITMKHGPFALENEELFKYPERHSAFAEKMSKTLRDHEKEPFIAHFCLKYSEPMPPAWVMIEILTMGNVSFLYSQLKSELQKAIARHFDVDHSILVSWLKALTELRNSCAHHARLFNKVFVNQPKIRHADAAFPLLADQQNRLGSFIPLLQHLLNVIGEGDDWTGRMYDIISGIALIKPEDMGLRTKDFFNGEWNTARTKER